MNKLQLIILLIFTTLTVKSQYLAPPIVSHQSGFYTDSFYLNLRHNDPNVRILYTLDGSEPKIENLTGKPWNYKKVYPTNPGDAFGDLLQDTIWTYEYTGPILIKDRSNEPDRIADISTFLLSNDYQLNNFGGEGRNVSKSNCLKIVAYKNSSYSVVVNRDLFVYNEGSNRYTLPIVTINTEPDSLFGYERGIYVPGLKFDNWSVANINRDNSIEGLYFADANYRMKTDTSEVKALFSYYIDGEQLVSENLGIRIHGNMSRFFPNKSFRLTFKNKFGRNSLNLPFWGIDSFEYKNFLLRNSGNDVQRTLMRDALINRICKGLNLETSNSIPSVLFVNGEYFGLLNLREYLNEDYLSNKYTLPKEEIDLIENNLVSSGSQDRFDLLMSFLRNNDLSDSLSYDYINTLIDIDNVIDYLIVQTFISNHDWPHNNNLLWSKNNNLSNDLKHDGKWRFLLKDLDLTTNASGYGHHQQNDVFRVFIVSSSSDYQDGSTLLFKKLGQNIYFRDSFVKRYCDLLNSYLNKSFVIDKIDEFKNGLQYEISEHIDRWLKPNLVINDFIPMSFSRWEVDVDIFKDFFENREIYVKNHLKDFFSLDYMRSITLDVSNRQEGIVKINTLEIDDNLPGVFQTDIYPWRGDYYMDLNLNLKALPKPGYKFSHWSGEIADTVAEITLNLERNTYVKANFIPINDTVLNIYAQSKLMDEVTIYPNPFNNVISVLADSYTGNYYISSVDGKLLKHDKFLSPSINLNELPKGMYIFKIITDSGYQYIKKIIKE